MSDWPKRIHIGTQKAGSTYFYNLLASHPDVALSSETEVDFYTKRFEKGAEWYFGTFAERGVRVDTSPKLFMLGEDAAPRIAERAPDARFVLILRNPVSYLASHFDMQVQQGHFKKHPERYPDSIENLVPFIRRYPAYLARAKYAEILNKYWLPKFSLDRFYIVSFERFISDTKAVMNEIQLFWNLPVRELAAPELSRNRALRFSWLHRVRTEIVKREGLKRALKRSRVFNRLFEQALTKQSSRGLSGGDRAAVAELLRDDVAELRRITGQAFSEWQDFS